MANGEVIDEYVRLLREATDLWDPLILVAAKTDSPQMSADELEKCLKALKSSVSVLERVSGTDDLWTRAGAKLVAPPPASESQVIEPSQNEAAEFAEKKPRKHDLVFDFTALEYVRFQESRERYASKDEMLRLLQHYDPRATNESLSPTLHKWKDEKKGWITWPPRRLSEIRLTDRGRKHLRSIFGHGQQKAAEVVASFRATVDPDYEFPTAL